jgi:AraC family transcriptional regulator
LELADLLGHSTLQQAHNVATTSRLDVNELRAHAETIMAAGSTPRIESMRGGRTGAIVPQRPVLSSAVGAGWQGLLLERHIADEVYSAKDVEAASNIVHFFDAVPLTSEWRSEGHTRRVVNMPGSMALEPRGFRFDVHCVRSQRAPQWILGLDQTLFGQRVQETQRGGRLELTPQLNVEEPQAGALYRLLQADVEAGCPCGPLYGELVGAALAVRLAHCCAEAAGLDTRARGGLPPARLRRVLEYIEANLGDNVRLNALAAEVGVSAFHFSRLFKQSTGRSPHQYLLGRRLERAKTLLRQPRTTLAEISVSTGFTDQGHFTKVFRRFVGVTPSEYRNLK